MGIWRAKGISAQCCTKCAGVLPTQPSLLAQRHWGKGLRLHYLLFTYNSSSHHSGCTSTNVLQNSHKKPKTHSGSLGFGCWTDSKAMERRLYLHLLCERRQLAGRRSESAARDMSQVARGLFQRAGGNWHCASTATGLLRPEHMM